MSQAGGDNEYFDKLSTSQGRNEFFDCSFFTWNLLYGRNPVTVKKMETREKSPEFDLFSPDFKQNPFPAFARMRRESPVYRHVSPGGVVTWYVTRYEDVLAVLRDNEHFIKDVSRIRPSAKPKTNASVHQRINENMLFADPPDHTRLRALVNQAFTPRRVEKMAGRIREIAAGLLDKNVQDGEIELITGYALPLPVMVICEMLGIPAVDQAQVTDWSQAIISPGSKGLSRRARKRKMREFVAYLQAMFADRRQRPQDDLITALVQAEEAGDRLSEAELSSMAALLLVTGHETTVNLIGNGALALLQNREQLALLRENEGLWDTAVEELLRYDGPVETSTTRWVRQDFVFRGQQMHRGDIMRVVLTSANRDAAAFACPDELNVQRGDVKKHLAFGHGIHYCLGAPLARLEGKIALGRLYGRYPRLRLKIPADQLLWRPGILFRGLETLPLLTG